MKPILTDAERQAKLEYFKSLAATVDPTLPPANPPDGDARCSICEGSGWQQSASTGRYSRCSCITMPEPYADGVPYEFQRVTLTDYEEREGQRTAIQKAKAFLEGVGRDLYLCGGVGAGKTRLACAIANTHRRNRGIGYFARVPMVLHQLQPSRDIEAVAALEDKLFTVPLLVLDDIGAERDQATDYTRRTLLMIYEERGDRALRTIFTSNKTLQQLGDMQDDDRLASRIAGRADVVQLTTVDQRLARRAR